MVKVIVWGTGSRSDRFVSEIDKSQIVVTAFVESKKTKASYKDLPVYEAADLSELDYDYLIIASTYTKQIKEACKKLNISLSNVIWLHAPRLLNKEELCNLTEIEKIIPGFGLKYCYMYDRTEVMVPYNVDMNEEYEMNYITDYVRYRTFDYVTREMDDSLEGDVAELGVYKGEFAKHINRRFPDRKLYLFDTFEGFDCQEAETELAAGHCDEEFIEKFKLGSEYLTLSKMKNRENCIVKKGLFPDSLEGLETKFIFVSLDVDFEKSIYEGLKYFYPRLVKGGYIFIHNYNDRRLKGVKKAVDQFEADYGKLSKVPIPDNAGTLLIVK